MISLIIQAVVGIVAAGLGIWVGYAVLKEKIKNTNRRVKEIEETLTHRVVYRDTCGKCDDGHKYRHNDIVDHFKALSKEVKEFKDETVGAFKTCMDDLVKELKNHNGD